MLAAEHVCVRVARHAQAALADVLADSCPRNAGEMQQTDPAVPEVVREKCGTPTAVQARISAVRKRSAPKAFLLEGASGFQEVAVELQRPAALESTPRDALAELQNELRELAG